VNRAAELEECLSKNGLNPLITCIYILSEDIIPERIVSLEKVTVIETETRPTFSALIKVANNTHPDAVKIIANTDIYFNETLDLVKIAFKKWKLLALSRWDQVSENKLVYHNNYKSQDVWIFKDTVPENIGNFFMGLPGCDNRLLAELKICGFKVGNPSLDIVSVHLHQSNYRTYNRDEPRQKVPEPYAYVLPEMLHSNRNPNTFSLLCTSRYKYYKSIANNTSSIKKYNIVIRLYSFFLSKAWAYRYNKLVKNISNSSQFE
jgi:hypothetical protein